MSLAGARAGGEDVGIENSFLMASIFSGREGGKLFPNNKLGVNNDVSYQGDRLHMKEALEIACSHRQGRPF